MRYIFIIALLAVTLLSVMAPSATFAQIQSRARVVILSYAEAKVQIESLPSFLEKYKAQRSVLLERIRAVNDAADGRDTAAFEFVILDLRNSYLKARKLRTSKDDLWVILFVISENPSVLSRSGWTDDEISKAQSWKGTFTETSNKIRKIDAQFPTDNQVEQVLRNSNLDVMFLLFAGLPSPAFILTTV